MQYRLREFLHELPGGGALRLSGLQDQAKHRQQDPECSGFISPVTI